MRIPTGKVQFERIEPVEGAEEGDEAAATAEGVAESDAGPDASA